MLYSYKNTYPTELPDAIYLASGYMRTDKRTFTEEEIIEAGFIKADNPPLYNDKTHKLIWDNGWLIQPLTELELYNIKNQELIQIRSKRDQLINNTIWRVQRYESEKRLGLPLTDDINILDKYIQALRDITDQQDIYNIIWPEL